MKQIICCLALLLTFSSFSQEIQNSVTDRQYQDDLKKSRNLYWKNPTKQSGSVTDFENLFSPSEKESLIEVMKQFQNQTLTEIGLITLDDRKVSEDNFEEVALKVAENWGFGKYGSENWIIFAVSIDHQRISIQSGKALSQVITFDETGSISHNYIIPDYIEGNFFDGTIKGIAMLQKLLTQNKAVGNL